LTNFLSKLRSVNLEIYAAAVLIFSLAIVLSTFRWKLCLAPFEKVKFCLLCKAYFVGIFVGMFMPSGGVDLIRGLYVLPVSRSKSRIFASIIVDRFSGFISIMLIILIGLPFGIQSVAKFKGILFAFSVFLIAAFLISLNPKVYNLFSRILGRLPLGQGTDPFFHKEIHT